ncbi:MAG: hypothetical protein ACRC1I_10100, partial [Pseudomonas proteolytica]|uniref:hypothetical protein n=1 Tax=Pseudomonas proteolytica TaxID=219574 RepID=UPI003F348584
CDGVASVCLIHRGDAIAGKPAPTFALYWSVDITQTPPFRPSGLPFPAFFPYTRRLSKVRQRVLPVMEINPILNTIKDLSERSETIRGYL